MKYAFLIYEDEPVHEDLMEGYVAFNAEMEALGVMVAGEALQPTATATTVRVRGGAAAATDGPFAETKEQLGGFYILECRDLDEAIACAAKIPHATNGSVEVRPLVTFEEMAG